MSPLKHDHSNAEHDLPSWWPEDLDIKEVEEAIQEAAGATDGSPRVREGMRLSVLLCVNCQA